MDILIVVLIVVLVFILGNILYVLLKISQYSRFFKVTKDKDDYVAMVVHDVRAPLAVIKGATDILSVERKNLSQEDVDRLIRQIHTTAEDTLNMVTDVLDISKIEAGKFKLDKHPGDLNLVVSGELDYFLPLANKSNLKINITTNPDIPKFPFDVERVKRVLHNLISNSLKFSQSGGEIKIVTSLEGGFAKVVVSDTGVGVPDDVKPKLFHKFVQGGLSKSTEGKGTGLGLVIAKEIVDLHGGRIWVEDNKPKGAKFIFTLPTK